MQNILLITADQLRADAMGHIGRFPVRTDNLDALAASGTTFTSAYAANPVCMPSRASIMTGKASYEHGAYANGQSWPRGTPTLASELSANGYYSVIVGKRHFLPKGVTGGFDKSIDAHAKRIKTPKQPSARPADVSVEVWAHRNGPPAPDRRTHNTVELTDLAIRELELINQRREPGPGGHEPFFMWLSYPAPHSPCLPPEPYFSMYPPEDVPRPVHDASEVAHFPTPVREWYDHWQQVPPEQRHQFRCQYLGDVTLLDEQIGRVLQHLRELGWDENTLIIFSSDHGDYLGDHGMMQKMLFHECSARVPLIFNGPGIPAGRTVNAPVTLAELMPTVLDYTDLRFPDALDPQVRASDVGTSLGEARSLMPAFANDGPELDPDRVALSETGHRWLGVMARWRDQKCAYYPGTDELEWYDLTDDPDELTNLGAGRSLEDAPAPMRSRIEHVVEEAKRRHGRVR